MFFYNIFIKYFVSIVALSAYDIVQRLWKWLVYDHVKVNPMGIYNTYSLKEANHPKIRNVLNSPVIPLGFSLIWRL